MTSDHSMNNYCKLLDQIVLKHAASSAAAVGPILLGRLPNDKLKEEVASAFTVLQGDDVEYFSKTEQRWVPCKALRVGGPSGAVEVDVKPGVWIQAEGVRKQAAASYTPGGGESCEEIKFAVGQIVEVLRSNGAWVRGAIASIKDSDVEVDIGEGLLKKIPLSNAKQMIRAPQEIKFAVGQIVEVLRSNGAWVRVPIVSIKDGDVEVAIGEGLLKKIPLSNAKQMIRAQA